MMQDLAVSELIAMLPTRWVRTYIGMFEAGRVQKQPQARFVNMQAECCLVAALVGASSAGDVVRSAAWAQFRGTELEELSRRFESCRLTGQEFYEECLLFMASRDAARTAAAVLA
jgi:hypothetical protein